MGFNAAHLGILYADGTSKKIGRVNEWLLWFEL